MVEELKNLNKGNKRGIELPPDLQVPTSPSPALAPTSTSPISPISAPTSTSGTPRVVATPLTPPPIVEPDLSYVAPPPLRPAKRDFHLGWWLWGILAIGLVGATVYFGLQYLHFNKGEVKFTFEPAGVNIVIDQKLTKDNINDLTVSLKAGPHIIQVTKEGFLDWEREIELAAGETATISVVLEPIPNLELVLDSTNITFPQLIRKDQLLGFWDSASGFKAIDLTTKEIISLFGIQLVVPQKIIWSPTGAAIVKLAGIKHLSNMLDNRGVKGRYIPLGESPQQGPTLSNGITTWLLDSDRRTSTGLQPILLSENIRDVSFSPDGTQIIYFYEAADGEKSVVMADNIDGSAWIRVATSVSAINPTVIWLNSDRYVLLLDDVGVKDKLLDMLNGDLSEIMPDRIPGTPVVESPTGDKILYVANTAGGYKLAVWNILDQKIDQTFDQLVSAFTWESDDMVIVATPDNNFWYWGLDGTTKPLKFVSSLGTIVPRNLIYSRLLQKLFILEETRIFSIVA